MKKPYEIDLDRAIARLCTASGKVKSTKNDRYYEQLQQSVREVVYIYRNSINHKNGGLAMEHLTLTIKNLYAEGNEKLWNVISDLTQHQLMDVIIQLDEVKDYELVNFLYNCLEYCMEV